jgi:hypothetical protein
VKQKRFRLITRASVVGAAVAIALLASAPVFAATHTLHATMSGAQETPPNSSSATGTCTVTIDDATGSTTLSGLFSALNAAATAAQLHAPAGPGTVAPVILAASMVSAATSGSYSGSATLPPAQVAQVLAGQAYCDVDDPPMFSSGQIRGQLAPPPAVPALPPVGVLLLIALLGGLGLWLSRTRWRPGPLQAH